MTICWQPMSTLPLDEDIEVLVVLPHGCGIVTGCIRYHEGERKLVDSFTYHPILFACAWTPNLLRTTLPEGFDYDEYETRMS